MDPSRFDAVVRSLAIRSSRRSFAGGLGALFAVGAAEAAARHKHRGHKGHGRKNRGQTHCGTEQAAKACAGRSCGAVRNACGKRVSCGDCPAGQTCRSGACQVACMPHTCAELGVGCGSAQDGCGGTLMCGPCPDGKECQNGTCAGTCGAIGDACTSDGTCCGGICGAQGTSANLCCTPDHQPVVAVGYCCNGNNAAYNQNGTVYCGTPNCTANADCDDHDPCTHDTCDHGSCAHTAIAGCCISEATCDDGNDCTVDTCVSNACIHTPKNDNDPCGSDNRRSCCQGQCCGTGRHCRNGTCAASGGCFVAGTRIAMVDGTSRPIEMVAPGDLVLGRGGQVNRVVALARPMLGGRPLYAFDGGLGFVTGGHPFLTDAGWKAVDPAAAQQEIPNLRVGRLSAGDRVLRLVGATVPVGAGRGASGDGVSIRITAVELGQIAAVIANPATPLFNLTVDGDHTYFADDWLAHNKFYSAEPTSEHTPPAKHHSPKSGKQQHT